MILDCLICERVAQIETRENDYLMIENPIGNWSWVLADNQFYKGYSILLYHPHAEHIDSIDSYMSFLGNMINIGSILREKLKPVRINYEILGNTDHHLHAHIIPRYADDPNPKQPIWATSFHKDPFYLATENELKELKELLL